MSTEGEWGHIVLVWIPSASVFACTLYSESMGGLWSNSHGYVSGWLDFGDLDPIFKVTGNIRMSNLDPKKLVCTLFHEPIDEFWSTHIDIWTASSEFGTYRICEQRRFRRACASMQSRQNLRCSLIQAVSQEEPSDRKPDPWPLWMAGHAQLKFVMTECSKTQIRLTGPISFGWDSQVFIWWLYICCMRFMIKIVFNQVFRFWWPCDSIFKVTIYIRPKQLVCTLSCEPVAEFWSNSQGYIIGTGQSSDDLDPIFNIKFGPKTACVHPVLWGS